MDSKTSQEPSSEVKVQRKKVAEKINPAALALLQQGLMNVLVNQQAIEVLGTSLYGGLLFLMVVCWRVRRLCRSVLG